MCAEASQSIPKKYYFKCPHCRNEEEFQKAHEEIGAVERGAIAFFSLTAAWILYDRGKRVQCCKCRYIFRPPPVRTPLSKLCIWIIWIIISFFVLLFFLSFPEVLDSIPESDYLSGIETFVKDNPKLITVGLVFLISALLATAFSVSLVSNFLFRRELRKDRRISVPRWKSSQPDALPISGPQPDPAESGSD